MKKGRSYGYGYGYGYYGYTSRPAPKDPHGKHGTSGRKEGKRKPRP